LSWGAAAQPCRRQVARRDRPSVVDAPAEEPDINAAPASTGTPGGHEWILLHREALFDPQKSHAAAKTYETFTATEPVSAAGPRPVGSVSARFRASLIGGASDPASRHCPPRSRTDGTTCSWLELDAPTRRRGMITRSRHSGTRARRKRRENPRTSVGKLASVPPGAWASAAATIAYRDR